MSEWLTTNDTPPKYTDSLEDEGVTVVLHKPDLQRQGGVLGAARSATLLPNVDRMLSGEDVENDGYDSDDEPEVLCGMRIAVRWQGNAWYEGVVKAYNPDLGEHLVHYMDDDKKWYSLDIKTWRSVSREPEGWQASVTECLRLTHKLRPGMMTRNAANELITLTTDEITARLAATPPVARNPAVVVEEDVDGVEDASSEDAEAGEGGAVGASVSV